MAKEEVALAPLVEWAPFIGDPLGFPSSHTSSESSMPAREVGDGK